jgi:predicted TIM-barrel fold metal-dependent hydrolase
MTIVDPKNEWRTATPGHIGWERTARPDDPNRYFIVSTDTHHTEPSEYLDEIEPEFADRCPRIEVDESGAQFLISEGSKPQLVKPGRRTPSPRQEAFEPKSATRHYGEKMGDEDRLRSRSGLSIEQRLADADRDGIDAEIIFPNKGLLCWATPDPVFQMAMCRAYNRWSFRYFGPYFGRLNPAALLGGAAVEASITEAVWAAERGYRTVALPAQPIFGLANAERLSYNDPSYEPLWATLEELGLPITFHVSTGRDPRAVGGNGGAVINYVCHAMQTTLEPIVTLISSGVFERHPNLRCGTVEAGIGWVPWMLETMDYAYTAHHFWVRPVIPERPSEYYKRNCFSTFVEDHVGLRLVEELELVDNFMWSNDYPHHEGTWPHSAAAIEREMGSLSEMTRAKLLGLNAARMFKLDVPGQH